MRFEERIKNIKIVKLKLDEYLQESIKSHKDKYNRCVGWDYLKTNLTEELKDILLCGNYWDKTYNSEKEKDILSTYCIKYAENYILNKELKSQLGSFVYVWNCFKRDDDEADEEEKLKNELFSNGFKEIKFQKLKDNETIDEFKERIKKYLKQFDGLKVKCVMDISCIGILGSYDKKKELEGKLFYAQSYNALMLIPKRCRTRGHIIRDKAYIKEVV